MSLALAEITPPPMKPLPWDPFPEIDLRQLLRMTDDTGMFQHARYAVPDLNHGYCIDDNARALIAALLHAKLRGYDERVVPLQRYLGFLAYAFNEDNGTFRNFMGYDRRWLEPEGSKDSQGRTVWALGLSVAMAPTEPVRELSRELLRKALPGVRELGHLRSYAFTVLGLDAYLGVEPQDGLARQIRDDYAERLVRAYREHAREDWPWWEEVVTYDNAKLSHAMLAAGVSLNRGDMLEVGLASLRWLLEVQTAEGQFDAGGGHLTIIGNRGWYPRGGKRAPFDQQPLEAYAMVHACLTAARITGETLWAEHAWRCFEWFRGRNDLGVPLYHEQTGGCQDGLQPDGPNKNQGAESILAYLLSVLELHDYRESRLGTVRATGRQTLGYAVLGLEAPGRELLEQSPAIAGLAAVGVWDERADRAEAAAKALRLEASSDAEALLGDSRVRLVHVAAPPHRRAELIGAALAAGKHVLSEPPLALDLVDAQQLINQAVQRDLFLGVNTSLRDGPAAEPMKRLIEWGLLGRPLRGALVNCGSDAALAEDHWFWDERRSGGLFVTPGAAYFDLLRWWLGEGWLVAALRVRRPASTLIDQAACDLRFGEAATVNVYHGMHQAEPAERQTFHMIFEHGEAHVRGDAPAELTVRALLSEAQIERLTELASGGEAVTLRRFDETERHVQHGDRTVRVDREVRVSWPMQEPEPVTRGAALRAMMQRTLETIQSGRHPSSQSAEDGRAALELALEARRLAEKLTP